MLARAEQGGGDGEGVGALQRLDRRAGGDPPCSGMSRMSLAARGGDV